MRLLVLSFYYPPDLSAGSFRAAALVKALRERVSAGSAIDVLTTLPNRYDSFARAAPSFETYADLEIRRIALPRHRSDMRGQSRAFVHFARGALSYVAARRYDLVYATSSRLMTAALGAWIARRKRARLYLDIRDIFVESVADVLPPLAAPLARAAFGRLESWTVRRADRINLVSPGFADYFRRRYGERPLAVFTNGIDEEFLTAALPEEPRVAPDAAARGVLTVLYAGNIGDGQGLHELLPSLAPRLRGRARFVVIGDGGRRRALEDALARAGADNVELRAPMPRADLIRAYHEAHVLLLHLGRHAAFEKVLPSKLFEYAALGKPVLAGVAGYTARFIREELDNAAVFAPCDAAGAVAALGTLSLTDTPRAAFVAKYARSRIAAAMADDVLALSPPQGVMAPP
jgi:glycosyltransferase involved in cell wall biosynthesis